MKISGAQALLESLKNAGVDVIFGYPGGQVIPIYDALYDSDIRHILVRHEQGAAHAADGYARSTGKVGVCLATSGPGATNLVTGIATAYMDSIPMVAITGQVPTSALGKDSFQEADVTGVTMPIVKHSYLVKDPQQLPEIIAEAFHIASSGRPGPVVVDIPSDISRAKIEYSPIKSVDLRSYKPTVQGHPIQIMKAARAILAAKKPVIYCGGGVITSAASEEVRELSRLTGIPVTTTLLGKGCFPEDDPLSLGMLGMHGTAYANYAVHNSDLLIAIGARFDDRVTGKISTFAKGAKIIHIDIDPAEIGKSVHVDIPIVGDVKNVLQQMLPRITSLMEKNQGSEGRREKIAPWIDQVNGWKKKFPLRIRDGNELKPQYVVKRIYDVTKGDAIITTEVGQHQMWAAQHYLCNRPRQFLSSGGLGTMGYGLPAAIGAQIGNPDSVVFDIAGDGSIQMNIQELMVAVINKLPVKVAILNNGYLGMVRQWQQLFWQHRYSSTDVAEQPDFVKLAEAYGAVGLRASNKEEVDEVLSKAMELKDKPCLIDFRVEREENVLPFVPAGGAIDDMMVD